jgi:diaminopimelate decarboxylase
MNHFSYSNSQLHAEQLELRHIAEQFGTPCYVYSRAMLEQQWSNLDAAFGQHPHTICYAVKANSNIAVLNVLARLGSGFDIVSAGELQRVLKAGGDPEKTVFSGVGKSSDEIAFAIESKIRSINVESVEELERIQKVALALDQPAPIALRINPDVDPQTHPYISTGMEEAKFGIPMQHALAAYQQAARLSHINIHSIACHIGSQITTTAPFKDAVDRVLHLVAQLKEEGIDIKMLDLGGGLGINYQGETPPSAPEYVDTLLDSLKQHNISLPISIEPGRYITGNAGVLLTRVEYLKSNDTKNFAIVDAGMNDLLRPSLYQAHHGIVNTNHDQSKQSDVYDVVGPVCESSDVLGYKREIALAAGDLLAIQSAGAYSFSMASNYNSRPRPAEVMVDGDQAYLIRARESYDDLSRGESLLP